MRDPLSPGRAAYRPAGAASNLRRNLLVYGAGGIIVPFIDIKLIDIELVDLTPEDLIARLNEGKVYVPDQAERAIKHFFSPGNLTAMRELALRRTAQRFDAQMVDYLRADRIERSWPASERVLVLVDFAQGANTVVRHANRMADCCARNGRQSMSKRPPPARPLARIQTSETLH